MKLQQLNTLAITCLVAVGFATAQAKTDVPGKIQQLKENAENSRVNLKQYEDNLKTVTTNLSETEKALKSIEKQKQALSKQTSESQKGRASLDVVKKQISGYLTAEKQKLDAEQKQIEEIKKTLAQLQANAQKRQENIAQYDDKMKKIDTEYASWTERNQSIVELEQALQAKEIQAREDNKRLVAKRASYEDEISKWRKQIRVSEREYANYSKLRE